MFIIKFWNVNNKNDMEYKLSIITINYNNAEGLRKTLESASTQSCMDFEHIVVDGASTDSSVEIIKQYPHVSKWISEPDKGIYNAMNKGIRMATGEYLLFLNSGDWLYDNDVITHFITQNINVEIATGLEYFGSKLAVPPHENMLTYDYFFDNTLLHQSTFIKQDAFHKYGVYREDYRIVSDWEWFFRVIIKDNASYQPLDFVVANFDDIGMSNNPKYKIQQDAEIEQVHQDILPRVRPNYEELQRMRTIAREYEFLKNGRFGFFFKLILKFKALKK